MLTYAVRRAARIVSENPSKLLKVFTPTGWKQFWDLTKEPERQARRKAAHTAQMEKNKREFDSGAWRHEGEISVRNYATYDEYIEHQKEKLDSLNDNAYKNPEKAVQRFRRRFELVADLPRHASILCLGARRGEEVRAFIELGHFAIGIDLNPGDSAEYVVVGDFHSLNFADASVDCVYTNCLDHALEVDRILAEINRVLKTGGLFVVDILYGYDDGYSAGNHDTMHWATARGFSQHLADQGGFKIEAFHDLKVLGEEFWTQSVMRKP